ncbi:MAG: carboxylate--amine ligase, partial [Myxococcales bacterium]
VAHAARRNNVAYEVDQDTLVKRLGSTLVLERDVPPAFAAAMGDKAYLLRHTEEQPLLEAIRLVQERA